MMRKNISLLFSLFILFSSTAYSQMNWLTSEKLAKTIATEKDQLILIDFWATWCGPCKKMDREMWNTEDFKSLSMDVVPLKIDIDREQTLAREYNIRSIPHVVLVTATGDIVWEQTGYSHAAPYKKVLEDLPETLIGINAKLVGLQEDFQEDQYFAVGDDYLQLGIDNSENLQRGFFSLSDKYYREITKNSTNNVSVAMADMKMLLVDAYRGKYKKVIKKIDKIDLPENDDLAEMQHFIKAYCYKSNGDQKEFEASKAKINSKEYLAKLE